MSTAGREGAPYSSYNGSGGGGRGGGPYSSYNGSGGGGEGGGPYSVNKGSGVGGGGTYFLAFLNGCVGLSLCLLVL